MTDRMGLIKHRLGSTRSVGVTERADENARNILIVDDLPQITTLFQDLCRSLRGFPVRVTTEIQSTRAVDLVKEKAFDLIVTDFRMPGADGIDILRASYERNPTGHRILMTGYNEIPTSIERIRQAYVDAYIQKPLNGQEMLIMLTSFLNGNEQVIGEFRRQARELESTAIVEELPDVRHRPGPSAAV